MRKNALGKIMRSVKPASVLRKNRAFILCYLA